MSPRSIASVLALCLAVAWPAGATNWQLVRGNERARLSVDKDSIKRNGDEVAFQFLIDLRRPEGAAMGTPGHSSTVTQAKVRCSARTIALGDAEAFLPHGAKGAAVGRSAPKKAEPAFAPLEKGSSDEDLWAYLCEPKEAAKK